MSSEKKELFNKRLSDALQWRRDVANGCVKASYETFSGFDETYAGFKGSISCDDLDKICEKSYEMEDDLCIGWSMGELRPNTK